MSFSIRRAKDSGSVGFVMPTGTVVPFAGSAAPTGWLLCFGQTVSRTTYPDLFATIGTNYGSGDGSTTFALPDMRGRTIAGVDNMGGSAASRLTSGVSGINATTLGAAGGDERIHQHSHANTLSSNTVASSSHYHSYKSDIAQIPGSGETTMIAGWDSGYNSSASETRATINLGYPTSRTVNAFYVNTGNNSASTTVGISNVNAGAGTAQNVPPTIVLNYIIKA